MSSKKKPHHHAPTSAPADSRPSFFSNTVLISLAGLLAVLLGYAAWQSYRENPSARPTETGNTPSDNKASANTAATPAAPASTPATPAQMQPLRGQWVRLDSDGNYILDIKSAAEDGKLDAVYLNPRPINVSRAEADMIDGKLRVFVELRDVNYPGSTYNLRFDADNGQLVGKYFQATQQEQFDVVFQRVK